MSKEKEVNADELADKCREYLAGWQRAKADYQNLKKETDKKVRELVEYAAADIILEALAVYSHFQLALAHQPQIEDAKWLEGLEHIKKEFAQFLAKFEVEEIKTAGEAFDPKLHEAVGSEAFGGPENHILKETRPGFKLKGRVIQPAQVIISKTINQENI